MRNFLRDLQKIRKDPKRLMRALGILWTRVWFLLIPMGVLVLLRSENRISDMILVVMAVALFLIATEPKSKKSKKLVFIIIEIKKDNTESSSSEDGYPEDSEDYTESSSSEDGYPEDYENVMDYVHYPFRDIDLNVRSINGFETEAPSLNWSLGKVYYINQDTKGDILWVWVQIYLYYPTPMPTQFILQCTLSEELKAHPISGGDFVLLEYHRRADEENFLNRTFTIIMIEKN